MLKLLHTHVPSLRLSDVIDKLFADEWMDGCLVKDIWQAANARQFHADPWIWDDNDHDNDQQGKTAFDRCGKRKVSVIYPLPPKSMGPKETRMTVMYKVFTESTGQINKRSICIESSASSHDIPYGDYFTVEEKLVLVEDDAGCLITKDFAAEFVKKTFFKPTIESEVKTVQRANCDKLVAILESYAETTDLEASEVAEVAAAYNDESDTESDAMSAKPGCMWMFRAPGVTEMGTQWLLWSTGGIRKMSLMCKTVGRRQQRNQHRTKAKVARLATSQFQCVDKASTPLTASAAHWISSLLYKRKRSESKI